MAEDSGQEKTEEASEHKLQELRKKGNGPQCRDFRTAFVVLAGYGSLSFLAFDLGTRMVNSTTDLFTLAVQGPLNGDSLFKAFRDAIAELAAAFAPFLILTAIFAGAVQWLQVGAVLSMEKLSPKLENLDPIKGLKRQFFS